MSKTFTPDRATLTEIVDLVDRVLQNDTLHTFVIGKAFGSEKRSERERFIEALTKESSIRCHYPEGLFDELIMADKLDLIALENALADSVDAVVMCVESYGSAAELGAFATRENLAKKLFVIINREFRGDKSFINLGPLRYMRVNKWGKLAWHPFETDPRPRIIEQIHEFALKRRKQSPLPRTWINPIRLEVLIHLLVMVYQPIAEHELLATIDYLASADFSEEYKGKSTLIQPIARAVIQKLSNGGSVKRELRVHPNFKSLQVATMPAGTKYQTHLSLAKEWTEILQLYFDPRYVQEVEQTLLDCRIRAMNSMLRNKR